MKTKNALAPLLLLFIAMSIFVSPTLVEASIYERTFSSTTSDGYIQQYNTVYNTAWANPSGYVYASSTWFNVGQRKTGSTYYIYRAFLFFDTSTLPSNASITSATLSLYGDADNSDTDFNITIQNGQPTYPHDPLVVGDYSKAYYSGDGGNASTSGFSVGSYNNITLTSEGLEWITKTGTTKLCLRSDNDVNGVAPTGNEMVSIKAREASESMAPILYVTYSVGDKTYLLHGAYNEQGARDGAINVTLYKTGESPETFELDGTENKTLEQIPVAFHFDVGYNESRVYYIKDDFEEIYVFKPSEPYYTYYFTVIDYVGITNGYLETLINVNGTNRIVERWSLAIVNRIPFRLSWGRTYQIRLVCDEGTYSWGSFVAAAEQTQTLLIMPSMFPISYPGLNVTVNAARMNSTWVQVNYTDNESLTDWVKMTIQYRTGYTWATAYTQNNTGSTQQLNWYSADATVDYMVKVIAMRDGETKTWTFSLPKFPVTENPWDGLLDALGNWPIPAENVIGLVLVLMVFGVFSYYSMPVGCVLGVLTAAFLTAIGWLNLSWNLIALAGAISIFAAIAKAKREEREI